MNFLYMSPLAPCCTFNRGAAGSHLADWSLSFLLTLCFHCFAVPVAQEQQVESQRVHHQMEEELSKVKQVSHTCRRSADGTRVDGVVV